MFKHVDVLGPPVTLTIESNNYMKTNLGALLSVFLFLLGIGAFLGFGMDIFYKEKPKVTFNRIVNEKKPYMTIDETNFLFSVYDQYTDKYIPDFNRRFTFSFDYSNVTDGSVNITRRISFEKCSDEVLKLWDGYFTAVSKDNYLCFPKGRKWPITGIVNQGNFTRIRMQMEYCMNNTDPSKGARGSNCIPKEETVEFMKGKRIQMHYIIENWLIDTFDFNNPGSKTAYTGYTNTDALSWARLNIFFKEILSDTDEGYFTVSKRPETFTSIESIDNEAIYSPETPAVFSHLVAFSRYKEIYTRSYIKVQDVFAMMGGFLSAAHLIFRTLLKIYLFPRLSNIFNNIIKFQPISDKLVTNSHNAKHPSNISSFISNPAIKHPNESNLNLFNNEKRKYNFVSINNTNYNNEVNVNKEFIRNTIKNITNKNYNINISLWKRLYSYFSKKKEQTKIYEKIKNKLLKVTSFENLIKLTKKTKILKNVMFNESYRYISKLCLYPQKSSEIILNTQALQENFLESLKTNDNYAKNLLSYLTLHEKNSPVVENKIQKEEKNISSDILINVKNIEQ